MSDETLWGGIESGYKRYLIVAAMVGLLTGGGLVSVLTYATEWVDMNSRPGDVMNSADITPELLPLIHDNQDEISDLWEIICKQHKQECDQ